MDNPPNGCLDYRISVFCGKKSTSTLLPCVQRALTKAQEIASATAEPTIMTIPPVPDPTPVPIALLSTQPLETVQFVNREYLMQGRGRCMVGGGSYCPTACFGTKEQVSVRCRAKIILQSDLMNPCENCFAVTLWIVCTGEWKSRKLYGWRLPLYSRLAWS